MRSARGAKPNITGFDMRKMRAAAGQPKYDPWERTSVNPDTPLSSPEPLPPGPRPRFPRNLD